MKGITTSPIWLGSFAGVKDRTLSRQNKLAILCGILVPILAGCATDVKFASQGEGRYWMKKDSAACVAGAPNVSLAELHNEAAKYCAMADRQPEILNEKIEAGFPTFRCATAEIVFRCNPKK